MKKIILYFVLGAFLMLPFASCSKVPTTLWGKRYAGKKGYQYPKDNKKLRIVRMW